MVAAATISAYEPTGSVRPLSLSAGALKAKRMLTKASPKNEIWPRRTSRLRHEPYPPSQSSRVEQKAGACAGQNPAQHTQPPSDEIDGDRLRARLQPLCPGPPCSAEGSTPDPTGRDVPVRRRMDGGDYKASCG